MKLKTYALLLLLLLPLLLTGCGSEDIEPSALSASPDVSEAVSEPVSEAEPVITWSGLYVSGKEAFEAGSYEEAIEIFTSAIEMNANLTGPFKWRAEAYWKLAETAAEEDALEYYRLAGDDYSAVVALGVDTADLHRLSGDSYYRANEYEKAWEHYSILMEGGETVDDEALIACSAYAEDSAQIAKLCLQKYFETKDSKYYDAMVSCWPTEVLQAYGDFLGLDDEMVFALLDWNMDGTPELMATKYTGQSGFDNSKIVVWGYYDVYTYANGAVQKVYEGYTDGTVVTPIIYSNGFMVDHGHGSGGYSSDAFVRMTEDGVVGTYRFEQWRELNNQGVEVTVYQTTPFLASEPTKVSEAEYNEQRQTCISDLSYELDFFSNTPENSLKYLHTDQAQKRQEAEAVLEDVKACVKALSQCYDYTFGTDFDYSNPSYYRTVIPSGNEYITNRLYENQSDIVLQDNEEWDPIGLFYYPISNFKSIDEIYNYLTSYLSEEIVNGRGLSGYFEEVNGALYAVRGGRGYIVSFFDTDRLELVDYDGSTCVAKCPLMDQYGKESSRQLTFQKGANGWILTEVKEI